MFTSKIRTKQIGTIFQEVLLVSPIHLQSLFISLNSPNKNIWHYLFCTGFTEEEKNVLRFLDLVLKWQIKSQPKMTKLVYHVCLFLIFVYYLFCLLKINFPTCKISSFRQRINKLVLCCAKIVLANEFIITRIYKGDLKRNYKTVEVRIFNS